MTTRRRIGVPVLLFHGCRVSGESFLRAPAGNGPDTCAVDLTYLDPANPPFHRWPGTATRHSTCAPITGCRHAATAESLCLATLADTHLCVRIESSPAITPTHD